MTFQSRGPLTTSQAVDILETLSLLTTKQHQNSKLVIYESKIALEPDSSTWRTLSSMRAYASTNVLYFAGFPPIETGSRDISDLPPLLQRVHDAFKKQEYLYDETKRNEERVALAEKAHKGLVSLIQHEYLNDSHKKGFVELAQTRVTEIITLLKTRSSSMSWEYEDPLIRQLREKNRQIELLERENKLQTQLLSDKERLVQGLTQINEKQRSAIARLEDLIVKNASRDDPMEVDHVSTEVLIGRIHALTGVLATRKH